MSAENEYHTSVSASVPIELKTRLKKAAEWSGMTMSKFIRNSVLRTIEEVEEEANQQEGFEFDK